MIKLFFLTILVLNLYGCGYSTMASSYSENKIFIVPVENKVNITSEARNYSNYNSFPLLLEKKLTNSLVNQFNTDGHFKVVSTQDEALVLECKVDNYEKTALRYTDSDDVKEQRLRLRVTVKLSDSSGAMLDTKKVVGQTSYFLSGPNRKSEAAAQVELIEDTVRRISEVVVERW
ncbi:MAG: hypothetical protein GY858_05680 [Candidatus Omnitrophica bacterium]|nr:hypothetical protein [Candidatus Omnitrophota bacterium]